MKTRPAGIVVGIALAVACVLLVIKSSDRGAAPEGPERVDAGAATSPASTPSRTGQVAFTMREDGGVHQPKMAGTVRFRARWGAGPGELGRSLPQEGNPEAPMSFAPAPDGSLVVLDQVNGRLVRVAADGSTREVALGQRAPQDVVVAHDGTLAVLDRLGDRDVALYGPDGAALGTLPLAGAGLPDPGAVTGLFVDGDRLYAEREHGQLVHVGDVHGAAAPTRDELQGRPTRDGRYTLFAGIIDRGAGRLFLAENARPSGANRFTRELDLPRPVLSIALLDSDLRGTLYLAALLDDASAPPELELLCAAEADGHLLGDVPLPANTGPEETFRDLAALDSGGVLYAQRSDDGVAYRVVSCP